MKLRLNFTQFLLLATLAGLLVGAASVGWRASNFESFEAFAVSPDGGRVVLASSAGHLNAWDLAKRRPQRIETEIIIDSVWAWGNRLAFVDGQTVALYRDATYEMGKKSRIEKWDVVTGEVVGRVQLNNLPTSVQFSSDGQTFAAFSMEDDQVEIWDINARRPPKTIKVDGRSQDIYISGNGERLLVTDQFRSAVTVYDARSGEAIGTQPLADSGASLFVSTQGRLFAVLSLHQVTELKREWKIEVFDLDEKRTHCKIIVEGSPSHIQFDPTDRSILCVNEGANSQLFDLATGKPVVEYQDSSQQAKRYQFTADGKQLVGSSQRQLAYFDAATGRKTKVIWRNLATLNALLFGTGFVLWGVVWGWDSGRR